MYVHLTNTVYALLMPMALLTARTRRPSAFEDLGHLPLLAGSFRPRSDPPPCTYVLWVLCMLF
jgi:hypothetical protein